MGDAVLTEGITVARSLAHMFAGPQARLGSGYFAVLAAILPAQPGTLRSPADPSLASARAPSSILDTARVRYRRSRPPHSLPVPAVRTAAPYRERQAPGYRSRRRSRSADPAAPATSPLPAYELVTELS